VSRAAPDGTRVHHGTAGQPWPPPIPPCLRVPPAAALLRHFPDAARGTKIDYLLNLQRGMPVRKILFAVTAFVLAVAGTVVSDAAEIKVLAAAPFKAALTEEFLPKFGRETGSKAAIKFDLAASLKPQIEAGEPFDVAILTPAIIDDLIKSGKIDTKSRSIIARIGAGIAIRQGASKPDISTTEAFKRALQGAKSIAHGDPAKGGAVPVYFVSLLQRLGIAEETKAKTKLVAPGETPQAVATGEAEFGIVQASELVSVESFRPASLYPCGAWNSSDRFQQSCSCTPS
jgi:molybdate transport system substrate-binding protein